MFSFFPFLPPCCRPTVKKIYLCTGMVKVMIMQQQTWNDCFLTMIFKSCSSSSVSLYFSGSSTLFHLAAFSRIFFASRILPLATNQGIDSDINLWEKKEENQEMVLPFLYYLSHVKCNFVISWFKWTQIVNLIVQIYEGFTFNTMVKALFHSKILTKTLEQLSHREMNRKLGGVASLWASMQTTQESTFPLPKSFESSDLTKTQHLSIYCYIKLFSIKLFVMN